MPAPSAGPARGSASQFAKKLDQQVQGDGGVLGRVPPSTLVDCTHEEPRLVREGAIPREQLRRLVGRFAP